MSDELAQQSVSLKRVRGLAEKWAQGSSIDRIFAKDLYLALAIHKGDPMTGTPTELAAAGA